MKLSQSRKLLVMAASVAATLLPLRAGADDIDIFTGASAGKNGNPRILIVIDNTSNWSSQKQQWPGGYQQGQSEVRAIKRILAEIPDGAIDMGMMEFVVGGTANDNGGFVRQRIATITSDIDPLTGTSTKAEFSAKLDAMFNGITTPAEKRNSNEMYGNLFYDVYNYWSGGNSLFPWAVTGTADKLGYTTVYSKYKSPLTIDNQCGKNYIIFIGNPSSSGPATDHKDDVNTQYLRIANDEKDANGNLITPQQLPLPNYTSTTVTEIVKVGDTPSCYSTATNAAAALTLPAVVAACDNYTEGCTIGAQSPAGGVACASGTYQWVINGKNIEFTNVPSTSTVPDSIISNADEFAQVMFSKGIKIAGSDVRAPVATYTIDVFNKQPNSQHTQLLLSIASAGNGKYFAAKNEDSIVDALEQILAEIQAVNSSFASTSLPVSATNRAQNANAVFIGLFRPDDAAQPRWFGNLKRFKLIATGNDINLGDFNDALAIDPGTGVLSPCAVSYWTADTPWAYKNGTYTLATGYWDMMGLSPTPKGTCGKGKSPYSDYPDGAFVEKGAAAQVLRLGNDKPVAGADWAKAVLSRNMLALDGNNMVPFTATVSKLDTDTVDFIRGMDINNERTKGVVPAIKATAPRPSIHGDVIHSRPLPVNYGKDGTDKVVVYYGANDGVLHAMNADTGVENWSFVAPEFYGRLSRLRTNLPLVSYPDDKGLIADGTTPKDYFFDGSIGVYQTADISKTWIFPTMRRGGRMVYGLDVTDPATPKFKWRVGCPNLGNDTGCTSDAFKGIGQTWSTPNVAFLKGYSTDKPVLGFGGGYDTCQDANTKAPDCTGKKGGAIYFVDGDTGTLLRSFPTDLGVVADIAYVDVNNDNYPDYAYALDLGGNVYRVDFVSGPGSTIGLDKDHWKFRKIGFTTGGGRKFMFAPAVLAAKDKVYLAMGTGDREHPLEIQYPFNDVVNRFYIYKDDLTAPDTNLPYDLDKLADYTSNTTCDTPLALPSSSLAGWFMDLNQYGKGEQVVTSAVIVSGMVSFSTNRPTPASKGTCTNSLGEARGYWVNLFNGSGAINAQGSCGGDRSAIFTGGGLPPSPVLATSVVVGNKPVSVIIGAVDRHPGGVAGSGPKTAKDCATCAHRVIPTITKERKRTYSYTKD